MKPLKIIHITDLHQRHGARLFYSTGKKINNGLVKNGHNVINISDRDLTNQSKNIFDISGRKVLFKEIIKNIENFKPDLIIFGHVDRLDEENFYKIKEKYSSIRLAQWFIDPLNFKGPDYIKNKQRFFLKYQFCDANFITTATDVLNFVDETKTFFIPNPIDPSIDVYKNYLDDKKIDIFLAISHGQHRGILKRDFIDDRVYFINKLTKKASYNIFGYKNNPVWGQNFFYELNKCSMGINLSRGDPIKYYSSDRISSLLGNGLLTFIHEDYRYSDFFKKNTIITFKNIKDLNNKILFYKKNRKLLKERAKNSYLRAHKIFNNQLVADFIVKKSLNTLTKNKKLWINI